jgi:lipopolysaccharide biosynthesis regulator YciM
MTSAAVLDFIASLRRDLARLLGTRRRSEIDSAEVQAWLREAEAARHEGREDEATTLYRRALGRRGTHPSALRGLREVALAAGRYQEAISLQQRVLGATPPDERAAETQLLATLYYEAAHEHLERGRPAAAIPQLKLALRWARDFIPASVALGDAQARLGERREAVRTWERALEAQPSLPVLARLEHAYRDEGRPTRMIALYHGAIERAPGDLALAVALGRVYLELEMLDEAADQLEKVEVRAPDLSIVHAYLAAVFERRGDLREACAEYRRALHLRQGLDWPHQCATCGAGTAGWQDRCPSCRRWNTLRSTQS